MNIDKLNEITTSMQSKLGENASLIADDIGMLITENNNVLNNNNDLNNNLNNLKKERDNLISVNANLLKQIPMGIQSEEQEEVEESKEINFMSFFDKKGKFKRN